MPGPEPKGRQPGTSAASAAGGGLRELTSKPVRWALVCLALYLVRVTPWALAELWHDEVITLGDFVIGPPGAGPLHVFRSYPLANNHVLFSALGWWWVRFLGFTGEEYLLRLPCLVFGGLAICLAIGAWRRWLGPELGCLAGVTLAMSPVFTPFSCEFRGYSLSMLLSAVAAHGLAELTEGHTRRGLWIQAPALALLPLVIPSNVFLGFAHALLVLLWPYWPGTRRSRLGAAAVLGGAAALGMAYYATLWDQFVRVLKETTGWPSGLAVLGAVAIGFLAHLGPAAFLLPAAGLRRFAAPGTRGDRTWGCLYAGCLAVPILGTVLGGYANAPFPRVYLVYMLPLTLAVLRVLRGLAPSTRNGFLLWAGLTIALGFAWERAAARRTDAAVARGEHPQNLLEQYYRGRDDLRKLAALLAQDPPPEGALLITDAYDFPTFRYYWAQNGFPLEAVLAVNRLPPDFWPRARGLRGASLHVVAGDERAAASLLAQVGAYGGFVEGPGAGRRKLYSLLPSAGRFRP